MIPRHYQRMASHYGAVILAIVLWLGIGMMVVYAVLPVSQPTSLVTGGAGFIGSHVADELLKMGHRVVVLDDLSGGDYQNVPKDAEFVLGSVNDDLGELFARHRFDYVFHLAAYAAEGLLSHHVRRFNYTNNLVGSVNLINEAVNGQVGCFVFASSIAVYGAHQMPGREAMTPQPEDPYGIAKYAVELDLAAARLKFGLSYIIFRPHNVYGERQNIGDKYRNVVGIFMNQALKQEPMTVFGDGEQVRSFSYIDDVAPIIARSVEVPDAYNQTFNIGSNERCSVDRLAREVSRAMQVVHLPVTRLEARLEARRAFACHDKAASVFKIDQRALRYGLSRMATWVKRHGARETKRFANIEVVKGLPESWR